jgi:hypothetical protein
LHHLRNDCQWCPRTPQNHAAGGAGLWSGYALPPSGPTGQASCRQPAKLIVAAQWSSSGTGSGARGLVGIEPDGRRSIAATRRSPATSKACTGHGAILPTRLSKTIAQSASGELQRPLRPYLTCGRSSRPLCNLDALLPTNRQQLPLGSAHAILGGLCCLATLFSTFPKFLDMTHGYASVGLHTQ